MSALKEYRVLCRDTNGRMHESMETFTEDEALATAFKVQQHELATRVWIQERITDGERALSGWFPYGQARR